MYKKRVPKKVIKEVNEYIKLLKKDDFPISEAYIYGSYSKGNFSKDSDIDLCIISPKLDNTLSSVQYLARKTVELPKSIIEPIGFSPDYFKNGFSSLIEEIKSTGIKIL